MKREKICGWCENTYKLKPIVQGGNVHTCCSDCGSNGPVLEFSEMRSSYLKMENAINKALSISELWRPQDFYNEKYPDKAKLLREMLKDFKDMCNG